MQILCHARGEAHVSNTGLARVPFRGSNHIWVGINPVNTCRETRDAKRQAAIAAPKVQNTLPAHEAYAAPLPELVLGPRPENPGDGGDEFAGVADRVR